jgi:hypothetical protein
MTAIKIRVFARLLTLAVATLLVGCKAQEITMPIVEEAPIEAGGPQFATISGVIRDASTGLPIGGALVQVGIFSTFTAADGKFELQGRCDVPVDFNVSRTGYQTFTSHFKFFPGVNTRGINLTPLPVSPVF